MRAVTVFQRSLLPAAVAALLSLITASPHPASAASDNTRGMAVLAAHVSADGHLLGGSGAWEVIKDSDQYYYVGFDRYVSGCFYAVTPEVGSHAHALASTHPSNDHVLVTLMDKTDARTSAAFNLVVYCAK